MMCDHRKLEKTDRYYINSKKHNNCYLCMVNENGPMTQEEIGEYLNITKVRVGQLEQSALRKFRRRMSRVPNSIKTLYFD